MELTLSNGRKAEFRALNARESMLADGFIPNGSNQVIFVKTYAICGVRSVNGEAVNALRNKTEFDAFADTLSLGDIAAILQAFEESESPDGAELKNGSSVTTSQA